MRTRLIGGKLMSIVNEKVYKIAVNLDDILFSLQIEKEIKYRSRVALANKIRAVKMLFSIFGLVDGRFGRIERDLELPEKTLTPDGDPIYRRMLDAFCKEWERQRKGGNNLDFEIMLILTQGDNVIRDIFKVE